MSKDKHDTPSLQSINEDVRTLMSATGEAVGEKIEAARERLAAALESGEELYDRARKSAIRGAKNADKFVRANPYRSLAIAFGAGALLALILSRRNRD